MRISHVQTVFLLGKLLSDLLLSSTRPRAGRGGGFRPAAIRWKRQEAPQAPYHLLQRAAGGATAAFPANPVPGPARESRPGCTARPHTNTGTTRPAIHQRAVCTLRVRKLLVPEKTAYLMTAHFPRDNIIYKKYKI